jgi:hypothetical protein
MPLTWSDKRPPTEEYRREHVVAYTPLGPLFIGIMNHYIRDNEDLWLFRIEWQANQGISESRQVVFSTSFYTGAAALDEAKEMAQDRYDEVVEEMLRFASDRTDAVARERHRERKRIIEWLHKQRADVPAYGWELANALAYDPEGLWASYGPTP